MLIHCERGSPPLHSPPRPTDSHLFKFEEAERWLWSSSLGSLTTPHLLASRSLYYRTWNALATYRRSSFIILGPETRRLPCYSRRTDGIKGWRVFIVSVGSVDNYWTIGFPSVNCTTALYGWKCTSRRHEVSKLEMFESLLNHLDVWVSLGFSLQRELSKVSEISFEKWNESDPRTKWKTDLIRYGSSSRERERAEWKNDG